MDFEQFLSYMQQLRESSDDLELRTHAAVAILKRDFPDLARQIVGTDFDPYGRVDRLLTFLDRLLEFVSIQPLRPGCVSQHDVFQTLYLAALNDAGVSDNSLEIMKAIEAVTTFANRSNRLSHVRRAAKLMCQDWLADGTLMLSDYCTTKTDGGYWVDAAVFVSDEHAAQALTAEIAERNK